ncbi:MAG: hypothetical protein IJ302_08990 [Clostridia bacterium]|nr:hypothetical protein [Clostridia bacterium]
MKFATRFFAILLCFTLCIIPLPFSVSAADITEDNLILAVSELGLLSVTGETVSCPKCGGAYYVVSNSGTTYDVKKHTASVCFERYYYYVNMKCQVATCGHEGVINNVLMSVYTHPTLLYRTETINGIDITAYHCPNCNYYQ